MTDIESLLIHVIRGFPNNRWPSSAEERNFLKDLLLVVGLRLASTWRTDARIFPASSQRHEL